MAAAGVAVLSLGAIPAAPALAGSRDDGAPVAVEWTTQHLRRAGGTVAAIDGSAILLTRRDGSPLTVTTTPDTSITTTGAATLADVTPGSFVVIRARVADDGTRTAKRIHLQPSPDTVEAAQAAGWSGWTAWRRGIVGVVASSDPTTGVVTVTTDEGPVAVATDTDTKVKRTTTLAVTDLDAGARIVAKGALADDGTFAATSVAVLSAAVPGPPTTVPEPTPTTEPAVSTTTAPPPVDDGSDNGSDDGTSPSNSRYHGVVASVDGATFAMTLRDGTTLTVVTGDSTQYHDKVERHDGDATPASLADVTVGAWVKVKGARTDAATLLAEKVTIGPFTGDHHDWDDGNRGKDERGSARRSDGSDGRSSGSGSGERGDRR